MAGEMEVGHVTPLTYCDRNVFETGVKYAASSWSNELEKEERHSHSASQRTRRRRFRFALCAHHPCSQEADVPDPVPRPRSRSSPERRTDNSSPRRTSSPSTTVLRNTPFPTPPAFLSPLLYNNNNAFGVDAFYSPRPPPTPLFLVPVPPNPAAPSGQGTKTAQPADLQTKVEFPDKKENNSKKFKSKESKKVVRYVMQTVLRGVYAGLASRAHTREEASGVSTRVHVEDISPAKDVPASPLFHSVASQTKPKTSFIRPTAIADADMDDLSISSEEHCTELDESCEWVGNVRALRDSHVRLVLRQLEQLREIERIKRALQRARATPQSPAQTPPTASAAHSAC